MRRLALPLLVIAAGVAGTGAAEASAFRTGAAAGRRALVQRAAGVPAGTSVTGSVAPTASVHVTLALTPSDPQALASYAQQVSDPSSALYRHYLSVGQFAARFGAGGAEVANVRSALTEAGLSVGSVSGNGLALTASGTAADVEDAFDTELDRVSLPDGSAAYADVTNPTLPSAAADAVEAVAGLSTLPAASPQGLVRAHTGEPPAAVSHGTVTDAGPGACSAEAADQRKKGGYTASDIGEAYGLSGEWSDGNLGQGATVALVELEPYTGSDVNAYQTCDGTDATVTNTSVDGGASCNGDADCGLEDVLDIEDVAGLAPDASIDVYEGPNTDQGVLAVYERIVESDAPIISTSWGECEAAMGSAMLSEESTIFEEAAAQGETTFAAAGDDGVDDCMTSSKDPQQLAVDDPASQPYVTGVGGTTMTSDAQDAAETVWNDSSWDGGAGGGGVSREWAVPSWQASDLVSQSLDSVSGSTISCDRTPTITATSTSCREVPDVSADADPDTGYDIYWNGSWGLMGGTSAAAPTWASLVALADRSSACTVGSVQVGFANPLLYELPSSDFSDVTSGNNTYSDVSGYRALAGYDMASGLGAPNGAALISALCDPTSTEATNTTPPATTTTTGTSPTPPPPTTTAPVQTTPTAPVQTTPAPVQTTTTTTTVSPVKSVGIVRFAVRAMRRRLRLGRQVRVALRARDRAGLRLRYSARRLPRGLRINRRTGVITGRPVRVGRSVSRITARDARGHTRTIVVRWVVTGA